MKTSMKRIVSMILATIMVLTMLPIQAFAVSEEDAAVILSISDEGDASLQTLAQETTTVYASEDVISVSLPDIPIEEGTFSSRTVVRVQAYDGSGKVVAQTGAFTVSSYDEMLDPPALYFLDPLSTGEYAIKMVYGDVQNFTSLEMPCVLKVVNAPVIIGGSLDLSAGTAVSQLSLTVAGYEGASDVYNFALIDENDTSISCTTTLLGTENSGYGTAELTYALTPSQALTAEQRYSLKISVASGGLYSNISQISARAWDNEINVSGLAVLEITADPAVIGGLVVKVGGVDEGATYTVKANLGDYDGDYLYNGTLSPEMVDGNGVFSFVLKKNELMLPLAVYGTEDIYITIEDAEGRGDTGYYYNSELSVGQYATLDLTQTGANQYAFVLKGCNLLLDLYEKDGAPALTLKHYDSTAKKYVDDATCTDTRKSTYTENGNAYFVFEGTFTTSSALNAETYYSVYYDNNSLAGARVATNEESAELTIARFSIEQYDYKKNAFFFNFDQLIVEATLSGDSGTAIADLYDNDNQKVMATSEVTTGINGGEYAFSIPKPETLDKTHTYSIHITSDGDTVTSGDYYDKYGTLDYDDSVDEPSSYAYDVESPVFAGASKLRFIYSDYSIQNVGLDYFTTHPITLVHVASETGIGTTVDTVTYEDGNWYLTVSLTAPLKVGLYECGDSYDFTVLPLGTVKLGDLVSNDNSFSIEGCTNLSANKTYTGVLYGEEGKLADLTLTYVSSSELSVSGIPKNLPNGSYNIEVRENGTYVDTVSSYIFRTEEEAVTSEVVIAGYELIDDDARWDYVRIRYQTAAEKIYLATHLSGYAYVRYSEDSNFSGVSYRSVRDYNDQSLTFSDGNGKKTVYVQFKKTDGTESQVYSWSCEKVSAVSEPKIVDAAVLVNGEKVTNVPDNTEFVLQLISSSQLTSAYTTVVASDSVGSRSYSLTYGGKVGENYLFTCTLNSDEYYFRYYDVNAVNFYLTDLAGDEIATKTVPIFFGDPKLVLDAWEDACSSVYATAETFTITGRATPNATVTISWDSWSEGVYEEKKVTATATDDGRFSAELSELVDDERLDLTVLDSEGLSTNVYLVIDLTEPTLKEVKATLAGGDNGVVTWVCDDDDIDYYLLWRNDILIKGAQDAYDSTSYIAANATGDTFSVVAVDYAGHQSVKATVAIGDEEAPSAPGTPTLTSHSTKSLSFSWDESTDNVAVYQYLVYAGDETTPVATLDYTTTSYDVEGLMESTDYTYSVIATDRAGNKSEKVVATFSTATLTITSSTVLESSYVKEENPNGIGISVSVNTEDTLYDLSGTAGTFQYKKSDAEAWTDVALTRRSVGTWSGTWAIENLEIGEYTVRFCVVDSDGTEKTTTEKTLKINHDTTPPVAEFSAPVEGKTYGGAGISLGVSATDNAGVAKIVLSYAKDGETSFTEIITLTNDDKASPFYPDAYLWDASDLESGNYTLRAVAYDLRNNASKPVVRSITVDNTPPAVPMNITAKGTSRYTHIMWDKSYAPSDDFSIFNVYRSDTENGTFERVGGDRSIGFYDDGKTAEAEKTYYYYVTAEDKYGNESQPSTKVSAFIVADAEMPEIDSMSPVNNAELCKEVTLRVSARDNYRLAKAVFEYRGTGSNSAWTLIGEDVLSEDTNNALLSCDWDISALKGNYEVRASVYDVSINDVDTESGMEANNPATETRTVAISQYTLPISPTVTVENGYKETTLHWTYSGNTTTLKHFAIYTCDADGGNALHVATVNSSDGSYTTPIEASGKYYFKVAAVDTYGEKAFSSVVTAESVASDQVEPNAVIMPETLTAAVGVPFAFSAANSTDNDAISSYTWNFGDGSEAKTGENVQHTYAVAGTYKIKLSVTDLSGNTDSVEKSIAVYDVAGEDATHALVTINVVNGYDADMPAVSDAKVKVFDGKGFETTLNTDSTGKATAVLPKGENTVSVVAECFVAATRSMRVEPAEDGTFTHTISLAPANFSTVDGSLSYTEMTLEEIKAVGIDVTDPDNQHVWKFSATFTFTAGLEGFSLPITAYYNSAGDCVGGSGIGWVGGTGSGLGGFGGNFAGLKLGLFPISENFMLVIYGEAHWLKEMYNVELLVINNSYAEDITDCVVTLSLPEGLSLAAMTSGEQTASIELGTIGKKVNENSDANTAKATWYVRGDAAGEYNLSATVTGKNPEPFTKTFTTDKPVKVYAGDALKLTITANDYAVREENYPVTFRLENVSDKPIYNFSFGITGVEQFAVLRIGNKEGDIYIGGDTFEDQFTRSVEKLDPGEYIEIEISTTIWFTSIAEVGEGALKTYLNTQGLGALGNFVNIVYYLRDVSVVTLEGSTTTIPYDIVINKVERPSLLLTAFDAAKELYGDNTESGTLSDHLVESFFHDLPLGLKEGTKIVSSLVKGSTTYDVRITIADGTNDGQTLKNEYISITSGTDTEFLFDQLNGITLKYDEKGTFEINGIKNGKTELNISISNDDFKFDYKIPITINGEEVETSFDVDFDAESGEFELSSDVIEKVIEQVQKEEGYSFKENPGLWFASRLNLDIKGKPGDLESILKMDEGVLDDLLAETVLSYVDIHGEVATLSVDRATLEKVVEAKDSEDAVKIIMRELGADVAKEKFGIDRPTYEFLIQVGNDVSSEVVSKFGEGEVAVQIPYELQKGESAEDIEIHRVKEDGSYELVPSTYDSAAGLVNFTTDQFSYYRIGIKSDDDGSGSWYPGGGLPSGGTASDGTTPSTPTETKPTTTTPTEPPEESTTPSDAGEVITDVPVSVTESLSEVVTDALRNNPETIKLSDGVTFEDVQKAIDENTLTIFVDAEVLSAPDAVNKEQVENALAGTAGLVSGTSPMYLGLTMSLMRGEQILGDLTATREPVKFTVGLDDTSYKAVIEGKYIYVVRICDGFTEFLDVTVDMANKTASFYSDRNATHALVVLNEPVALDAGVPEQQPDTVPETPSKTPPVIWAVSGVIAALTVACVCVLIFKRRKE